MKGILAAGILFVLMVVAVGLAGGFAPLWDVTYPWQCARLCDDDFWATASPEDVKAEIQEGADVTRIRASDGNTPLHLAVRGPTTPEILELLLKAGADPNTSAYRDLDSDPVRRQLAVRTPLQSATEYGEHHPEIVRLLLEYGANPNPPINPDSFQMRSLAPLTYSLWGNERYRNEIVELLLQYGAAPHIPGWRNYEDEGATALHVAAGVADPDLLEVFLRHGADFNVRSDPRRHYIEYANGSYLDTYYSEYPNGTVLHSAAKDNPHPESIEFLIELGIDVNAVTLEGLSPLHLAIYFNTNSEVVEVLLESGADPYAGSSGGFTPLLWAITGRPCADQGHCKRVVGMLLDRGADPTEHNDRRDPILHRSILYGQDIEVIQMLVNHGADVTVRHAVWRGTRSHPSAPLTPLQLASYVESPTEVIELLIDHGADVNAKNEDGETPLHLAAGSNESARVVQHLLSRGADANVMDENGDTPLHWAAREQRCRDKVYCRILFEFLLHNGANPNALNSQGVSPLHIVVSKALDGELVRTLLEFGADPSLTNAEGATALHMALALRRRYLDESERAASIVHALLESGVDVNLRSGPATGSQEVSLGLATPLHWEMFYASSTNVEVAKALLRRGADLQATNQLGETPCQMAVRIIRMGYVFQQVCT